MRCGAISGEGIRPFRNKDAKAGAMVPFSTESETKMWWLRPHAPERDASEELMRAGVSRKWGRPNYSGLINKLGALRRRNFSTTEYFIWVGNGTVVKYSIPILYITISHMASSNRVFCGAGIPPAQRA